MENLISFLPIIATGFLIAFFVQRCNYDWEIIKEVDLYEFENSPRPYATKIVLQCKNCGSIKKKKI